MELEEPQAMTKQQLYCLYYPGRGKKGVNPFFRRQIYSSAALMEKLERTGFSKRCKLLSIVQVSLIFDHLTPPIKQNKRREILYR